MNPTPVEIRQFILNTFREDEFVDLFCADYFRDVLADFATGMSFRQKAQRLIEYCQHREIVDNLLSALQKERPEAYAQKFGPVIVIATMSPATARVTIHNPHQVFISYAHEDADFAHCLANDLRRYGWPVWIAPDSIRPGEKWVSAIERGLACSGLFIVVLTPAALQSTWVESEICGAIELEHKGAMRLIPLLYMPCALSGRLISQYQYVLFVDGYDATLQQLLAALKDRGSPELSNQAPIP